MQVRHQMQVHQPHRRAWHNGHQELWPRMCNDRPLAHDKCICSSELPALAQLALAQLALAQLARPVLARTCSVRAKPAQTRVLSPAPPLPRHTVRPPSDAC